LIQQGAHLASSPDWILETLHLKTNFPPKKSTPKPILDLCTEEEQIILHLQNQALEPNELVIKTGLDVQSLNIFLTLLTLKGLIIQDKGLCTLTSLD
jgi:predicted Rossmann fold nucleotide-binding protein DprA/Smf involved in DNA uptake